MNSLEKALEPVFEALDTVASKARTEPLRGELGTVFSLSEGTAKLSGLRGIGLEEVVRFEGGELGIALTLEPEQVGVVLLDGWCRLSWPRTLAVLLMKLKLPILLVLNGYM